MHQFETGGRMQRRPFAGVVLALTGAILGASLVGGWAKEMPKAKPEDVGMSSLILSGMVPSLRVLIEKKKIPGAVVLVARHGKLVWESVVGYDRDDYIFRLFSQSKPVTAVAALMCIEDGLMQIDDPVTKYLPEFRALRVIKNATMGAPIELEPLKKTMTIKNLLTHTGGLTYGDVGNTTVDAMYRTASVLDLFGQDLDQFVVKVAKMPLVKQPGMQWRYSVGFDVLGAIIQRVTKMPFDQFLRERLFMPLDMKDTGFMVQPKDASRLVPYWTSAAVPGFLIPIPNIMTHTDFLKEPKLKSGGGGLVSTARDFMRFVQMLLNGGEFEGRRYLKKETVQEMLTNQLPEELKPFEMSGVVFNRSDFGLGVAIQRNETKHFAPKGEASWGGAGSTNWFMNPGTDTIVVVMTQVAPFMALLAEEAKMFVYMSIKPEDPSARPPALRVELDAVGDMQPVVAGGTRG